MSDKEMIEEMTKDLKDLADIVRNVLVDRTDIGYIPDLAFPVAKEVLKHYQSKLPKDSVVLSREEYERLLKIKEGMSVKEINYFSNLFKLQKELEQVEKERDSAIDNCDRKSKETAEKYKIAMMLSIQEMHKYLEITEEQAKILYHHNAEIAKQFGVEIKE